MSGFVRLDHYGGVAEESFYTNERVRLTALSQLQADDEAGFWSAFLEVVAHLQYDDEGFSVAPGALTVRDVDKHGPAGVRLASGSTPSTSKWARSSCAGARWTS